MKEKWQREAVETQAVGQIDRKVKKKLGGSGRLFSSTRASEPAAFNNEEVFQERRARVGRGSRRCPFSIKDAGDPLKRL